MSDKTINSKVTCRCCGSYFELQLLAGKTTLDGEILRDELSEVVKESRENKNVVEVYYFPKRGAEPVIGIIFDGGIFSGWGRGAYPDDTRPEMSWLIDFQNSIAPFKWEDGEKIIEYLKTMP